jgi:hypothetical protein
LPHSLPTAIKAEERNAPEKRNKYRRLENSGAVTVCPWYGTSEKE